MTLFGKSSRFDQIYFGILLLGQLLIHLALQTTAENLIFQKQGMFLPILILSILILFQRKFLFSFSTARENTVCVVWLFFRECRLLIEIEQEMLVLIAGHFIKEKVGDFFLFFRLQSLPLTIGFTIFVFNVYLTGHLLFSTIR